MNKFFIGLSVLLTVLVVWAWFNKTKTNQNTIPKTKIEVPKPNRNNNMVKLTLTSPAFVDGGFIPAKYTCDGEEVNPPLKISGVPKEADSLVLVMDDPDIPSAVKEKNGIDKFNHWVLYNLPPDTTEIPEGIKGETGLNTTGAAAYIGPCPPPQYEPTEHRYVFRLYAIKGKLNFIKTPTLDEVETAAKSAALAEAELVGRYGRARK